MDNPAARRLSNGRLYTAVIFDMDGLLLDTELIERQVWQRASREAGCSLSDADFTLLVGRTEPTVKEILTALWAERGENPQAFDEIIRLKKSYYQEYIQHHPIPLKAGAADLIHWLDEIGFAKAVASSSRHELVLERLRLAGLRLDSFAVIVGGDQVSRGKPAPDIFLLAAQRLGVPASHCLVLEDSDSGIYAASAAGMIPIMIPDSSVRLADPPTAVLDRVYRRFATLTEVIALLKAESLG